MKKWFMKWLGIASLLERLDSLEADAKELRNDITELSRELAIENARVAALQTKMDVLESKIKEITITDIENAGIAALQTRMDTLESKIKEITITDIENAGIAALQTRMDTLESKIKEIAITGIDPGAGSPLKSDNIVLVYGSGKKVQSEKQTASSTAVSPVVSAALDAISSSKRSQRGRPKKTSSATTE